MSTDGGRVWIIALGPGLGIPDAALEPWRAVLRHEGPESLGDALADASVVVVEDVAIEEPWCDAIRRSTTPVVIVAEGDASRWHDDVAAGRVDVWHHGSPVGELTARILGMSERDSRWNHHTSRLVHWLAHDLRSPLSAAGMHLSLLMEAEDMDSDDFREDSRALEQALDALRMKLSGIYMAGRAGPASSSDRPQGRKIDLAQVLKSIVGRRAFEGRVRLDVGGSQAWVQAHERRLTDALTQVIYTAFQLGGPVDGVLVQLVTLGRQASVYVLASGNIGADAPVEVLDQPEGYVLARAERMRVPPVGLYGAKRMLEDQGAQLEVSLLGGGEIQIDVLMPMCGAPQPEPATV